MAVLGHLIVDLVVSHGGGSLQGGSGSEWVVVVGREVLGKWLKNPTEKFAQQGCELIGREGLSAFFSPLLIRLSQGMSWVL